MAQHYGLSLAYRAKRLMARSWMVLRRAAKLAWATMGSYTARRSARPGGTSATSPKMLPNGGLK